MLAWVIGGGGLLGASLVSELARKGVKLFTPPDKFRWDDADLIISQLTTATHSFAHSAKKASCWHIYWAAGIGAMSSVDQDFVIETKVLDHLIKFLLQGDFNLSKGTLIFTSSAGAIYSGVTLGPTDENTSPCPINSYGLNKLNQEILISRLNKRGTGAAIWVFRVSTLYGVMQNQSQRRGLLSEIARRISRNQTIHIFVPLETMRDYIEVNVAAQKMVATVISNHLKQEIALKIIASEVSVSIAQILGFFKKITKKNFGIVTSASPKVVGYARAVQYRSINYIGDDLSGSTSLIIGIANLLAHEKATLAKQGP